MGTLGSLVVAGMAIGAGTFLVVIGGLRAPIRLVDILALLDGTTPEVWGTHPERWRSEAAGEWLHGTFRLPITRNQRRLLLLSGRSVAGLFTEKPVLITTGLLTPTVQLVMQLIPGNPMTPAPLFLGPVSRIYDYFLADLRLSRTSRQVYRSTSEVIHTFFDLVVLGRLTNAFVTQAAAQAATISDTPLSRHMAADLERCRLEQITPWQELHRTTGERDVPELDNFVGIMYLEEQGATLAETLQARVRELREGYLAK